MLAIVLVMLIPKVENPESFFSALDASPQEWTMNTINNNNWAKDYPYAPDVKFAIAHTGKEICIRFYVDEECSMARAAENNGSVWKDSCVEFFINFDKEAYYNFEINCIGTGLLGLRKKNEEAQHASDEIMSKIYRSSTLGSEPFEETKKEQWELSVVIPVEAFFGHDIKSLDGMKANANFYKCGDDLSKPHYLSWNKIDNPKPNFHLPEFFGKIEFAVE